jgi:putative flippase GtrA
LDDVGKPLSLRYSLARFLLIGAGGTACYLGLYLLLRTAGTPAQVANVVARVTVAVPTTWLGGRYAFGATHTSGGRLVGGALTVLAVGTLVSLAVLGLEQELVGTSNPIVEALALCGANLGSGGCPLRAAALLALPAAAAARSHSRPQGSWQRRCR